MLAELVLGFRRWRQHGRAPGWRTKTRGAADVSLGQDPKEDRPDGPGCRLIRQRSLSQCRLSSQAAVEHISTPSHPRPGPTKPQAGRCGLLRHDGRTTHHAYRLFRCASTGAMYVFSLFPAGPNPAVIAREALFRDQGPAFGSSSPVSNRSFPPYMLIQWLRRLRGWTPA